MNIFAKIYCRIFQTAFRMALPMLPYREPEIIRNREGSQKRKDQLRSDRHRQGDRLRQVPELRTDLCCAGLYPLP